MPYNFFCHLGQKMNNKPPRVEKKLQVLSGISFKPAKALPQLP